MGCFYVDCASRVLIGWRGKLWSRDKYRTYILIVSAGKSQRVPVVLFYIYVQMRRQILKMSLYTKRILHGGKEMWVLSSSGKTHKWSSRTHEWGSRTDEWGSRTHGKAAEHTSDAAEHTSEAAEHTIGTSDTVFLPIEDKIYISEQSCHALFIIWTRVLYWDLNRATLHPGLEWRIPHMSLTRVEYRF